MLFYSGKMDWAYYRTKKGKGPNLKKKYQEIIRWKRASRRCEPTGPTLLIS